MIRVSGQSKSRPVKAAGAESGGQRINQKLHAAVVKSAFWSESVQNTSVSEHFLKLRCRKIARRCGEKHIRKWKCTKKWRVWTTFVSSDVEKMHAPVAKGTFGSENAQNMTCLDHFCKFWCCKIVRPCGERHIRKWKCTKHEVFGPLL